MTSARYQEEARAAIRAIEAENATESEKAEMLMEIAMGLQIKPKNATQLQSAITLYEKALELTPKDQPMLRARIEARLGTALRSYPGEDDKHLFRAKECFESALNVLNKSGKSEEIAEIEMNLGLVLQTLSGLNKVPLKEAISAYQRALRGFDKEKFPKEFAILQNNLATAFLSIPMTDQRAKMQEALAVQSFEEALKVVSLIDHPNEYAMLQNNLGNALQYSSSSHAVENNVRALTAYDEALKVRSEQNTPIEYANTLSNKANCLLNLPDDPTKPEDGNIENCVKALKLYEEARDIFLAHQAPENAAMVSEVIQAIQKEFEDLKPVKNGKATV